MPTKLKSSTIAKMRPPIHPGEVLREELLEPLGLSLNRLAEAIHVPANRLSQIVRGLRASTPDTSLRLSRYFGFSPEYWMNLQAHHDFEGVRRREWGNIEREIRPRDT